MLLNKLEHQLKTKQNLVKHQVLKIPASIGVMYKLPNEVWYG